MGNSYSRIGLGQLSSSFVHYPQKILLTFPNGATAGNGDWLSFNGAIPIGTLIPILGIDGPAPTPSGPVFTAQSSIPFFDGSLTEVLISSADTAAQVATAFLNASVIGGGLDGNPLSLALETYYTALNNGDGTILLTRLNPGPPVPPFVNRSFDEARKSVV